MIQIDPSLCIGCGQCVRDCISEALTLQDGKAFPSGDCIQCGHCVAICPVKAAAIPAYDMEDVEEYEPAAFTLDAGRLLRAVKFRRSVRDYQPRPVEKEKLDFILQAGRYTATAVNYQDCRFIVVQEQLAAFKEMIWDGVGAALALPRADAPEGIARYRRIYRARQADPAYDYLFRNAPAVLFVAADIPVNAGLASQNMELAAVAQGLGMLYNGYLVGAAALNPQALGWLNVGAKQFVTSMLLGYPAVSYRRTAPRRAADIIWR